MRSLILLMLLFGAIPFALSGCGGGGNGGGDSQTIPTLSVTDAFVLEGNSGNTNLTFTVTLSAQANGIVSVNYVTGNGSATAGSDYTNAISTLTIPAGQTNGTISVVVAGDTDFEPDETLSLALSSVSVNAALGRGSATGTIINDDHAFNDTGITAGQCYQVGSDSTVGCGTSEALALSNTQDGMTGRDADWTTNSNTDGKLGFNFVTVAGGCVQDNATGLMWEVKTTDGGLRDKSKNYTNYGDNRTGDATDYVVAVNATSLCGHADWRLPTVDELQGIVDYGVVSGGGASAVPSIDTTWFPNTPANSTYWSSSTYVSSSGNDYAWRVSFLDGSVVYDFRSSYSGIYVRLVRSVQ